MKIFFYCYFLLGVLGAQSQQELIRKMAIPLGSDLNIPDTAFDQLKRTKLFLMGEMHGTLEPALFVNALTELFVRNGCKVKVGLEIPKAEMQNFIEAPSDSSLSNTQWFNAENQFGRNTKAYYDLILNLSQLDGVSLFYFDNSSNWEDRDSLMYQEIWNECKADTNFTTICLTGNIHNSLELYKGKKTMGWYLFHDNYFQASSRLCSVEHIYHRLEMFNNKGDGMKLNEIQNEESDWSLATDYSNYILSYQPKNQPNLRLILYTENVQASYGILKP